MVNFHKLFYGPGATADYNILHFVGHSRFDTRIDDGVLVLEDENKRGDWTSGEDLGVYLRDQHTMRLAVLNSCEGARGSVRDPFSGVAQGLVQQGLPAVIAMQFEITDEAAIIFSRGFYAALARGYPVDAAVAQARKAIRASPLGLEWGTPVLYLRARDGVIFEGLGKNQEQIIPVGGNLPPSEREVAPESIPTTSSPISPAEVAAGLRTLNGHTGEVACVAFSPDGALVASGSDDNTLRLWRMSDGGLLNTLRKHTQTVVCVAFSPDGLTLASGTYVWISAPELYVWRVPTGTFLKSLLGHTGSVNGLAFSPDGALLASVSGDKTVRLWSLAEDTKVLKLPGSLD